MAFFGITQLGYQDTIREHMNNPPKTPQQTFRSGDYRDPAKRINLPPIDDRKPMAASVCTDQFSGYGPGPEGSYKENTRLLNKHIRRPADVEDIYRYPVITSTQIAQWKRDEPLREKEPWTYVKRRIRVNSEMTRFVNGMALTNREFSLF